MYRMTPHAQSADRPSASVTVLSFAVIFHFFSGCLLSLCLFFVLVLRLIYSNVYLSFPNSIQTYMKIQRLASTKESAKHRFCSFSSGEKLIQLDAVSRIESAKRGKDDDNYHYIHHQYLSFFNTEKNTARLAYCYQTTPSPTRRKKERRVAVERESKTEQEGRVTYTRVAYLLERF